MPGHRTLSICPNGQNIEVVEQMVFLSGVLFVNEGTELDVSRRIKKAKFAFAKIHLSQDSNRVETVPC